MDRRNTNWAILGCARFGFAAWVLFAHTHNFGAGDKALPVPDLNALVAVYAFLAISGFSIRHSLEQSPDGYARRRFWRIVPTHLASLVIAGIAYMVLGPILFDGNGNPWPTPSLAGWVSAALLLQAFLPPGRLPILFPSWSLSIECVYYACAPILRRLTRNATYLVVLASFAFCIYRPHVSSLYIGSDTYGIAVVALAWSWLAGWVLGAPDRRALHVVAGSVIACLAIWVDPLLHGAFNYVAWVGTLALCAWSRDSALPKPLQRFGNYLGEVSYPLYLIHYPVFFLVYNGYFKEHPLFNTGVVEVSIAIIAACLVLHLIERPLRRRSFWVGGRRAAVNSALH